MEYTIPNCNKSNIFKWWNTQFLSLIYVNGGIHQFPRLLCKWWDTQFPILIHVNDGIHNSQL